MCICFSNKPGNFRTGYSLKSTISLNHIEEISLLSLIIPWCSWLRHCATSRNVAGLIPDGWHYGPLVDSASNRNEYQGQFLGGKGGRLLWLTNLPPSCAHCLEIWEHQTPESLWACNGPDQGLFTFAFYHCYYSDFITCLFMYNFYAV